ncbi:MAG: tRNA (adenine-N1)-methyltransferase [Actinomycetia bacterium]|nr:tRNA (adenine-N1)-methyltransferase [Actinomycetes bacterium]MCP4227493.1 tRNA (adenine-N1)-methyltransferase [Actinomycetes bacterium]MCP5031166.1 tRNA (adenine-N1)-methyltransferase [Actinomycetes bacterium]
MNGALDFGELVMLIDHKKRRYLITLEEGREFQSHAGVLPHEVIVGQGEGAEVATTRGQRFRVFRPTLSDYVLSMPRGAQVIYPKDLGPMVLLADIGPGMRVLESGVGSGALSMTMLRAGAEITGYELREDFAARATNNVKAFLGAQALERYRVELRNCYDGIDERDLDRVVLDLPEPWNVIPHAEKALRPGGILVSYSPSITQVMQLTKALERAGFSEISTTEVMNRTWHIDGAAVRPDHRMVAHTGFLTRARAVRPGGLTTQLSASPEAGER